MRLDAHVNKGVKNTRLNCIHSPLQLATLRLQCRNAVSARSDYCTAVPRAVGPTAEKLIAC